MLISVVAAQLFRYDRKSYLGELEPVHLDRKAVRPIQKAVVGESAFKIFLNCTAPKNQCDNAKLGFERAGSLIAKSLNIDVTINVLATFRSFCGGSSNCALSDTLGQAYAASYFAASAGDAAVSFYPQALVKQLQTDLPVEFNNFDIIAEFNSDFPFYFPNVFHLNLVCQAN
jgi:hypothetical protein